MHETYLTNDTKEFVFWHVIGWLFEPKTQSPPTLIPKTQKLNLKPEPFFFVFVYCHLFCVVCHGRVIVWGIVFSIDLVIVLVIGFGR
jgi:hypothetical protein